MDFIRISSIAVTFSKHFIINKFKHAKKLYNEHILQVVQPKPLTFSFISFIIYLSIYSSHNLSINLS